MSNINIELVVNWSQICCPFCSRMNRLGDGGLVGWWSMVGWWSIPSFKVYSKIWRAGGRWWAGGQSPHLRIFENLVGCMNKWWADGQFIHLRYVQKFGGLTVVGQNAFTWFFQQYYRGVFCFSLNDVGNYLFSFFLEGFCFWKFSLLGKVQRGILSDIFMEN